MKITVTNCRECPFANNDNEWGYDMCNLSERLGKSIQLKNWEELPNDGIHQDCPITNQITIIIDK